MVAWMQDGMFPGVRILTGGETSVDDVKKDLTRDIKTESQNPDAVTIRITGS